MQIVSSVQLLSRVRFFATPWTAAGQASLSIINSWVYPNPCPLSWWCHPTISSSVTPFSFCFQSFLASGSFPMSWLFTSGGQSIGASASAPPVKIQGWFPITIWLNSPFYNGEITTFCGRNLCHSRWDIGSLSYLLWLSSCLRNGVCMGLEKWLLSWALPWCIRCSACCMLSHFSCAWLCDTMDCSLPGFSVHEILQARVLDGLLFPSPGSFWCRDWTWVSCIASTFFIIWATGKSPVSDAEAGWLLSPIPVKMSCYHKGPPFPFLYWI